VPRAGLDPARVAEAAAQIADARGLHEVSLQAVADRLGVRTPSLYNHVDGLPALRRLLALDGMRGLREALAAAALGRSGAEAVRAMALAYRAFAHAHPGRYAAAQAAPPRDDAEAQAQALAVVEVVFAVLRGFDIDSDDLIHATRGLRSAMHGFIALESAGGFGLPAARDESYRRLVDVVIAGLRTSVRRARSETPAPPRRRPAAKARRR